MKTLLILVSFFAFMFATNFTQAQCNTNISICTPGQAGPFNFAPASANPSSCLDYWNGQAAPNYAYIVLYITQGGDLNLLIDANTTGGFLDVSVFDITGQADPCASLGTGTELGCNYATAASGCNQFGTAFPCASTAPAPVVNTGDVIMILVEDWSDVQTSFTLELGTTPGSAQTGPPDATINPQATLCTTDAPVQLTAVDNGGTWTGTGVSPTGVFDPGSVAPGTYNINYSIGSAPCDDSDATTVTVIDCSAGLPCPDYANTATAASTACGGQLFDFEVANTACNGLLTFDVVGNYGSSFANEITWEVTSNLTGNVVASGGPGFNGGAINAVVNLDPNIEGTFFTMSIFDSFGDGFNGTGGFFQIEQNGAIISGPVTGNFGTGASNIFGANVSISTSTITINTPSGPVTSTVGNCADHDLQFLLDNANYCTPINVNLPWSIVCDETGAVISSGTHAVTVYPQIPTASTDLVDISWNAATCQWDVIGQNDCDALDIGSIFTISPDPSTWPANTCNSGNQDFTVSYIGVGGGPDCCSTGGPLGPTVYNQTTNVGDVVVASSPFGGTNNSAYTSLGPSGQGGVATSLTLNVDMTGYCFPNVPGTSTDEFWVTIIIDGQIVYDQMFGPPAPTNFNTTLDLTSIPGGFDENSVVEVYIYPNFFNTNPPGPTVNATYVPGAACGSLNQGEWTASTIDVSLDVTFTEQTPTAANCTFVQPAAYTCCTTTGLTASNPATVNVQCPGDVPAPDPLVVTDEAGPCNPTVAFLNDASDGLSCPETITRTYRVSNDCGDILDVQQLIVINDTQAPVFNAPPADVTVECIGDIPAMTNLGWTDNCDGTGSVTGSDGALSGGCPATMTRTWTYTDACGNTATETQTITVDDTQAPVFAAPPATANVQCAADVPAMVNLGWTDNCDGAGTVTGADVSDGQTCPETITRTWTYTDACGNTATETQTITVHDTQAPVLVAPPANVTVECAGDVPAMTDLGWTDNCDGSGTVTGADVSDGQTCPETITRTWTYTDACGNNATVSQTIIVDDTTPPTASNPAPIIISGGTPVPNPDPLVVTDEADNCTVNPVVAWVNDVSDNGNCPEIITRTYSVTDECGNQITVTQIIEVGDAVPPTASNPAPINVQCAADVPAPDPLVVTDEADNGAPPVVTFESDTSDGQSCPETITRTYRVTDDCGNFIFVTQTITIHDTQAPVFNAPPADVTVECIGDVPAMTNLGWTDNCDGSGNVTGSDVSDGQSCPETITRTWTYTDACGNTATETQIITVHDTQAPVFAAAPADASYQCIGDVPAMTGLGWTDNCDGSGTVAGTEVSDGQTCPETIIRTWTYTDACGNTSTETQTITVHDTQAPVLAAAPADASYQCIGDVPAMTGLGWTDNCDGSGTVAGTEVSDGQTCPETITRTWTYTDACGNTATETQTITVHDTQAPVLAPPPANVTVECAGDVPAMTDLGWTDNCDGAGTVTGADVSDGQTCPETITRTWTYTDACGNNATVSQTIIVDDTTPPTASNPAGISITQGTPVPNPDPLVVTDEADNCTVNPVVAWVSDVSDNGNCPEIITRTYSITDECGNQSTVQQTITIGDPVPPTASNPAPINVQCAADVPAPDPLVVTDEADNGAPPVVTFESDASDGQSCPETITRTYRVTDDCGNFIFVTQTITIHDTQAPVFNAPPADVTVECIGDVPAMTNLGWTDNCDGAGNVTGSDVSDGQSCPETITRTWTYTDACGNTATETQIITVHDTQAPVFAAAPADASYQCIGDVPVMTGLGWTDNCDGSGTVAGTEVSDGQTCPETITRTWTYTDACGNTSTETQTITVHDTQAPVLAAAPADASYQCIGDVPAMTGLGWTDNCDGSGTVAGTEVSDGQTCPETITRTWTYTDACGNTATETQTITVHDTQAPVFAAPPANVTVECAGDVPAMTDLGWTDNCDGAGTVTGADVSDGQTCPETITRTWTYTDACGNNATVSQTIIVDDTTPPTASNPATTVVPGGPAPPVDVTVVNDEADNCTVNPTVTFVSETSDNNPCPETITRIYEITDDCGNTTQVTHLIQITDPIMPTGTAPADITVECIGDVPAADPLLITDEADNQGVPTVAHVGDVSNGQTCPETITRTYSITDVCGNQITVDQIITVQDITAPVMAAAPADVTVECIGDVPAMTDLGWTDNCDGAGTVTGVDVSDGQSCPETITRTWTYTDACGNTSSTSQTITVIDTQAPVFAGVPAATQVECIGDVPAMISLNYTDNCDAAGSVMGTDVSDGQTCPETITRTWTYTDACGNTATETQTITVIDTQAPVFAAPPANVTVQCIGDVPAMTDLGWTDNCDGTGTVTGTDVSDGQSCPETITRTWTYTDNCGNTTSTSQTIVVDDTTPPTASNPAPISVPGPNDVPAPDPSVVINEADNCTANPVVAFVSSVSDGNVCNGEIITHTYSVTDDCGNQTLVTHEITILATPAPIDAGNDTTICLGENVTISASNPWNAQLSWSPQVPQGPFSPAQTTTYTVTADNYGCISTDQITVTVEEPPVVSFVGDVLSGCAQLTVNFTNLSTATSGISDCEWTINGTTLTGCNPTYTFNNGGLYDVTLTTTSTLGCSSTETYTDYIYVEDLPLASFTASQTELSSLYTEVIFTNNSTGATNYQWDFGSPGANSTEVNPTHTFPEGEAGTYTITLWAYTDLGCADSTQLTISVSEELIYWVPNTFTPDGDDFNDVFMPVFTEGYDPFDYHLTIFNRWGEIVFESYDATVGWDASYGLYGREVQDGTYTWKIEFKTTMNDERVMVVGHVNVIK
ncbi:MAG: PKD domain-containing protein [Fluviicola sp.]